MNSAVVAQIAAIGTLVILALLLICWAVTSIRRMPFTPAQTLLFGLNMVLARVLWRVQISGPLPLKPGQGAVIVCNHRSSIDPSFITMLTTRVVHWMVAEEYFEHAAFGRILRLIEAIPVSRGGFDTTATRMAIRYVADGEVIGMFPEGRINRTDAVLLPGRRGAAMIALKTRTPVIPCYLSGSPYDGTTLGCLLMPARVRLQVGEPIDISEYFGREGERAVLEELTLRFLTEIASLAGEPDFKPTIAGRPARS